MKKYIKRVLIIYMLFMFVALFFAPANASSSNLKVMVKSDGTDLTYRNSSEKVYQLAEYNYPTNQLRAAWVSLFVSDIASYQNETQWKAEVDKLLTNLESMGMNAMVFHVRTHNNALYKSELNPVATWFKNANFDEFDPLEYLITECHNRGVEFHAWLNPYRVSNEGNLMQYKAEEMNENNPATKPENLLTSGSAIILDPGIPENREFIVDTCMELIENYDVDAINFDDYFYINGADDTATREKYNTSNLSTADFRRLQVNLFIEELSKQIRTYNDENGKAVQLGIAPSGIYRNGSYKSTPTYDANGNLTSPVYSNTSGMEHYGGYLFADTLHWINEEWIDYIMPQLYWATEHTNASFVELTKWWSWAVRNKNVNFYAGMGIYMADSPNSSSGAYWQKNEDEIERQLLNAGQYEEFGGACMYKYSFLFSSNTIIKNGVDLISNDYWAKRIPGAVVRSLEGKIDEITPTNVRYISSSMSIAYDKIDSARGYMIYQVPKGKMLDTKNIDHVYLYTQDTNVKLTDTVNYDYYVASVNKANEISETVYVRVNLSGQNVVDLINNLPANITIEDKGTVEQIRNLYNLLSDDDKLSVTNIDKLVAAEQKLADIHLVEILIDEYLANVDTHIMTNRRLPQFENGVWSYKNPSDISLYDITTGEKFKNPLATTLITLVFTLTQGEVTATKEVDINIGYTAVDQKPLFYRNDPSCMNEDDEGQYDITSSKYIGWSGHTVVVEDTILFIAQDNYHEITDKENILSCKWTSAAGVYVNKSGEDVEFNVSQAFGNLSSGYDGYFIISKVGQIKALAHGYDSSVNITIEDKEAIVLIRYLDGYMDGSPWAPVTNLHIGYTAYIDTMPTSTDDDLATSYDERVNMLPLVITLADEVEVNELIKIYASFDDETKGKVTTYQKVLDAKAVIDSIKSEIEDEKAFGKTYIQNYADLSKYSAANQKLIKEYISLAIVGIDNAKTVAEVDFVLEQTTLKIDAIPLYEVELAGIRTSYIEKVNSFVASLKYNENEMKLVYDKQTKVLEKINSSSSETEMNGLYNTLKTEVNAYHKELEQALTATNTKLNELYNLTNVEVQKVEIQKYIEAAKTAIVSYATVAEINSTYATTENKVSTYIETISNAISEAIAELESTQQTTPELVSLVDTYKHLISNSITTDEVDSYLTQFNEKVIELTTLSVINAARKASINNLNSYFNSLTYNQKLKAYVKEQMGELINAINVSTDVDYISHADNDFISVMNYQCEYIVLKINSGIRYVNNRHSDSVEADNLKNNTIELLKEAGTVNEINQIINDFDKQYSKLNRVIVSCDSLSISFVIYTLTTCLLISGYMLFRKK